MPVNPALRSLATDCRISLQDAQAMQQMTQSGTMSQAEATEALERYGEVMDADASVLVEGFTGTTRSASIGSLPDALQQTTLTTGDSGPDVRTLQRALMALGQRQQTAAFTLPSGVDGAYGGETTRAVSAIQAAYGLPQTGTADPATMRTIDTALRAFTPTMPSGGGSGSTAPSGGTRPARGLGGGAAPVTTTPVATGPARGTPEATVAAAEALVNGPTSANYGVAQKWINNDPRHALPANKEINSTAGRWKCNLFAGNVMAAAGFEPPYYGNLRTGGEYPNANQLYKWSDKYAARFGNQARFTLADEMRDMPNMTQEERTARLDELFAKLQPGDLLIADHQGTDVSDGGHCRVYLGKDENGVHRFAQASYASAEIQLEGPSDVMGEEHLWILRPNTARR